MNFSHLGCSHPKDRESDILPYMNFVFEPYWSEIRRRFGIIGLKLKRVFFANPAKLRLN